VVEQKNVIFSGMCLIKIYKVKKIFKKFLKLLTECRAILKKKVFGAEKLKKSKFDFFFNLNFF
jgi:5-methylcytosine-specific restriction endonuclease McrBC regulatory subunit McrC